MSRFSYKTAFNTARAKAGVDYRLYDARHTFVTRLAENPKVSEETIRQLAGHVSPPNAGALRSYPAEARRAAIATLEPVAEALKPADIEGYGAQKWAQSADRDESLLN